MSATRSDGLVSTVNIGGELAGDTIGRRVTVTDADGDAVDITDFKVRVWFEFSRKFDGRQFIPVDDQSDITLEVGSGVTLTTAAGGILDFVLGKTQSAVSPGSYRWAVKIEDDPADDEEHTIVKGIIHLAEQLVD